MSVRVEVCSDDNGQWSFEGLSFHAATKRAAMSATMAKGWLEEGIAMCVLAS